VTPAHEFLRSAAFREAEELETALAGRMQGLNELLEDGDLALQGGESLFVAFEPPSVRVDFADGGFVFDATDVQDVARKLLMTTMGG